MRVVSLFLLLGLAMLGGPQSGHCVEFEIDPQRSTFAVRLQKAGIGAAFAHNHVIHATELEGSVTWSPEQPSASSVTVNVNARSLVADNPDMRARYDLAKKLDADIRREIQSTMESESQLDVEQYPGMSFESHSTRAAGDGSIEITGVLDLHGQEQTVSFTTTPEVEHGVLRADAEIVFKQTDFGIEPYSGALGTVRNKDQATLMVQLVATERTNAVKGSATAIRVGDSELRMFENAKQSAWVEF